MNYVYSKFYLTVSLVVGGLLYGCTNQANNAQQPQDSSVATADSSKTEQAETETKTLRYGGAYYMPSDERLKYVGRFSFQSPDAPSMGYSGAQIYANFTGTSVSMLMKPGSGYFMVTLDDREPFKVISQKDSLIALADHLPDGHHQMCITQLNEAVDMNFPEFYGLVLNKDASLCNDVTLPERRIEFIGNSMTCALGMEDTTKTKSVENPAFQNAYMSYAAQTARRLNAQLSVVARSGIGVYRNNCGPKDGEPLNMQYYYLRSQLKQNSEMWDFSRFVPDLICINLGTNDTSQSYIVQKIAEGMKKLVLSVREHNPKAKIVILTGTMRKGKRLADQKLALNTAFKELENEGVKGIYRFDMTPDDGKLGYGTGTHPSIGEHGRMADELTPFLQKIMNW